MRALATSLLTFAILLVGVQGALGWYGARHHLPQHQMADAWRAGDGCFLFLGDSRMVAAFDARALHRELRRSRNDRCLIQLAIGATDIGGAYLTAREYLSHGQTPLAAVIGKVGDSLLGSVPTRPEEMIGNNAIHLTWSHADDVFAEVPGFPLSGIDAFDAGFRFIVARATALGRYQSLVSIKVQRLSAALIGEMPGPRNKFGALGDMVSLGDVLRTHARTNLAAAMRGSAQDREDTRYGRWFGRLLDLLREHGVTPVVVELPMRQAYRQAVTETPEAAAYQRWLAAELARRGGDLIDLAAVDPPGDEVFEDELHLDKAGAALVSAKIGEELGATFARRRP